VTVNLLWPPKVIHSTKPPLEPTKEYFQLVLRSDIPMRHDNVNDFGLNWKCVLRLPIKLSKHSNSKTISTKDIYETVEGFSKRRWMRN
jgi:hypothetical protein